MADKKFFTLVLPPNEYEELVEVATNDGVSVTQIIRQRIRMGALLRNRVQQGDVITVRDKKGRSTDLLIIGD